MTRQVEDKQTFEDEKFGRTPVLVQQWIESLHNHRQPYHIRYNHRLMLVNLLEVAQREINRFDLEANKSKARK
jgi:hypothetical protein